MTRLTRLIALAATLAVGLALAGRVAPITRAIEQGTITVTKTWAADQEPNEVVEVCFVVTADPDGAEVLGEDCTVDDTYTVSFGPTDPDLQTGVPYYVWEDVGAGWDVSGDNPIEVVIPDTTGGATVTFENRRAAGTATVTIHKATCPAETADLFGSCHENRLADVRFVVKGERVVTDAEGVATADVASGPVRITEAAADFTAQATAGSAYVFCSIPPNGDALFDGRADHRSVVVDVPAGAGVVCDWYDLTAPTEAGATVELHKRVCPLGRPAGDIFEACHDNPPEQPVAFAADRGTPRFVDQNGDVVFAGLDAGSRTFTETEGPPLAYVELRVYCSVQGTGEEAFPVATDGPSFTLDVDEGAYVICDVYNIPLDLSGRTPTPTATAAPPAPTPTPTPTPTAEPIVGRPVHLHAGTCDDLARAPRYDLTDLTTPEAAFEGVAAATVAEASYSVIDVPLDELLAGEYAINAHESAAAMEVYVACGEIGGPRRADGAIVVGLREQNGSGLTGIAYLSPDPADPGRTRVSVFLAPGLAEEDRVFRLPEGEAVVIESAVDNGPVSPKDRVGYEVTIDATGQAVVVVTPAGASPALGGGQTAEQEVTTVELGVDGLQALLRELDAVGYFGLTQAEEVDPGSILVGGPGSYLSVTLADDAFEVSGNGLPADEAAVLEAAQRLVAEAVGGVEVP